MIRVPFVYTYSAQKRLKKQIALKMWCVAKFQVCDAAVRENSEESALLRTILQQLRTDATEPTAINGKRKANLSVKNKKNTNFVFLKKELVFLQFL